MTVGEKIRKFRIDQGYTQKELAIMSGLSESAIRNYELGNRFPSSEQLEKIANSLKISPYAMSDPNFDTYVSVMHALFALEDQYGLHAYRDESGVPQLMFKDKGHDSLNMLDNIGAWADMYQKFRNEAGARVMDFSGSVDLDKIMMLMEVEMQMINPSDDVIIVGAKNSL